MILGGECPNSADRTVVYVSAGDSVVLACDPPDDTTTLTWLNATWQIIVGHIIGGSTGHPNNPPYTPEKYSYDTGSHSLTIIDFRQSDEDCIRCQRLQPTSFPITAYLVTVTGIKFSCIIRHIE